MLRPCDVWRVTVSGVSCLHARAFSPCTSELHVTGDVRLQRGTSA